MKCITILGCYIKIFTCIIICHEKWCADMCMEKDYHPDIRHMYWLHHEHDERQKLLFCTQWLNSDIGCVEDLIALHVWQWLCWQLNRMIDAVVDNWIILRIWHWMLLNISPGMTLAAVYNLTTLLRRHWLLLNNTPGMALAAVDDWTTLPASPQYHHPLWQNKMDIKFQNYW